MKMKLVRWFKSLSVVDDIRYAHHIGGESWWSAVWTRLLSFGYARYRLAAWWCDHFGHDIVSDGADAENGSEDLRCQRCGWCETVYF